MQSTIFYDNFKDGLTHWQPAASGPGATAPALTTLSGRVWYPPVAVAFGVGNGLGAISQMSAQYLIRQPKGIGFEVGWSHKVNTRQFEQWIYYKPGVGAGVQRLTAQLKYNTFSKQITIYTPSGDIPVVALDMADFSTGVFMSIKVVCDFAAGRYSYVQVGGERFNVAQHAIPADGGVGDYQLLAAIVCRQVNAASINDPTVGYVAVTTEE